MNFMKKEHGCERNFTESFFGELGWEIVQQIISDEDHDCFRKFPNQFASKGSPLFYRNLAVCFQNNRFCFENDVFLIHGLGKCEGVGEDSRHGFWACRHSSRITYLLECVFTLDHYICT